MFLKLTFFWSHDFVVTDLIGNKNANINLSETVK